MIDQTVGEAETSYEHTVLGDRRGQAICWRSHWSGDYGPPTGCNSRGKLISCLIPHVGATGEGERSLSKREWKNG